jgi:hypothetical protein
VWTKIVLPASGVPSQRGRESRRGRGLLAAPAPFVFAPAAFEVAGLEPGQGAVPVGADVVGLVPERHLVGCLGLDRAALLVVGAGQVGMGLGVGGVEVKRFVKGRLGFVPLAEIGVGQAEIVVDFR